MAKVYLHHKEKESQVFDTETEAYAKAINEEGWCKDRLFGKQEKVTAEGGKVFSIKDIDTKDLIVELKARQEAEHKKQAAEDEAAEDEAVKLSDLKKPQLQEIAKELEITFTNKTTNKELIELILEKQGAQDEE